MAFTTNCCLNISPPPTTSIPISTTPEVSSLQREGSCKRRCLVGLTCAIIGLELGNFEGMSGQGWASAADLRSEPSRVTGIKRWSDRRACQPWRVNSLETIVPENLPRPSLPRRWRATGLADAAPSPVVGAAVGGGDKSCFSL